MAQIALVTSAATLTFTPQKKVQLFTSGADNGSITRLIELSPVGGSIVDRPWISWFDFVSAAQCAAIGAHNTLPAGEGGTQILQWELKTIADPASPNPGEMRTRIGVKYNTQRGVWGVNFVDYFEINQGENPPTTYPTIGSTQATGLRIRTSDSAGTNAVVAQFIATIDGSDNVTANLDVLNTGISTAKTANLIIGRNTNTSSSSGATIFVKKMDGSNTSVWQLNPRVTPITNTLGYTGDSGFNIVVASDTGLRIGTATTQKVAAYGATPVVQPTAGAATAAGTYGANEQTMLQTVYNAMRSTGWMS
jgi:hypothetical protein